MLPIPAYGAGILCGLHSNILALPISALGAGACTAGVGLRLRLAG